MDAIHMYDRVAASVTNWTKQQEEREALGIQPEFPFTDIKSLVLSNMVYFLVVFALYEAMKRREEGFNLRKVIFLYNLTCIALAGYVVLGILSHWNQHGMHKFVCNEEDYSLSGRKLGHFFYIFYLQKFWEWLDTVFFLLKRSFRQVSTLHLFHHSSITFVVGLILPKAFSGDMFLPILLNATVHLIMYSHYAVTSLGVKAWWKPWLTSLQLIQFVLISTQSIVAWRAGSSCGGPDFGKFLLVLYMGSMLYLFGKFFFNSYISKPKSKKL